jgi:hypothetical protein
MSQKKNVPASANLFFVNFGQKRLAKKKPSLAKTVAGTKNGTVPGKEGLNAIIACSERGDFGGQEPMCAYSTYT